MLVRLADWCYRRRRLVVVMWIAALAGSFALSSTFGGEFRQDYLQPGSESKAALDTLKDKFPRKSGDLIQIVVHSDAGVTSPSVQARAQRVFADVVGAQHVVGGIHIACPVQENTCEGQTRGNLRNRTHHGTTADTCCHLHGGLLPLRPARYRRGRH